MGGGGSPCVVGALMDLKGAQLRLNMDMERRKNEWANWSTSTRLNTFESSFVSGVCKDVSEFD